ncbi:MAG: ATP-binding cassette domain-containing protein [Acidimicrobiales bacterium]
MSNLNPTGRSAGPVVDRYAAGVGTTGPGPSLHPRADPAPARAGLAVEARGIHKSFGEHPVLEGVDLEVIEGTVFCLLGPNGSGKTTTIRILSTLLAPDAGTVRVAGHDASRHPDRVRGAIGVTGQFSAVDKFLTGRENLTLMADLAHLGRAAGRRRVDELLDRFDLVEAAGRTPATYSGGMRRRLDLAMTLVGHPRIIFLDEPTAGLDPRGRHVMWQIVRRLVADDGVTILLTTQYLDEADRLADRIAVLDRGAIVAEGTPEELKGRIPGGHVRLQFADPVNLDSAARLLGSARRHDETLSLEVPGDGTAPAVRTLLVELDRRGIDVETLSIHSPDLDDVFFAVTGLPVAGGESRR